MRDYAAKTMHSTTADAAEMAKLTNAKKLLIGHFSARYHNLTVFENETRELFENTETAREGKTYTINAEREARN